MNIDQMHAVSDASPATIAQLSDMIAASRTEEQLIYRETEMDELWRLLAIERNCASGTKSAHIAAAMAVVMQVHDLIGVSGDAAAAAAALRKLSKV